MELLAVSFIFILLISAIYWQGRKEGRSHTVSLNETIVVAVFFTSTATIQYFAVISKYA